MPLFAEDASSPIIVAFWESVFQLLVLGVAGFVANIIYRRLRDRATAQQELLNDIDDFSVQLYRPRKIYQIMIDNPEKLLSKICTPEERELNRLQAIHQALQELVEATGRFRTIQVVIISLYGFNMELLSHYLAIWYYLKEIRRRMGEGSSLYFLGDKPEGGDDFYRLFDSFRYRVSTARVAPPVSVVQPPEDLLAEMHRAGAELYKEYFGERMAQSPHDNEGSQTA